MGTCKSGLLGCLVVVLGLAGCGGSGEEAGGDGARPAAAGVVHVYNWSDYIAEDTIPGFERETGIKVTYGMFDSNELLEAKLLAGGSGFDVVVPSLQFLGRQIQAGVFQPLDKSRLENYSGLDPALMERIAIQDPGNQYAVPYLWGTTGIGYNVDKVVEAFGSAEVADSWSLLFDPDKVSKLAHCGVMLLDTPSEAIPAALAYLGEDPNSHDPEVIRKGAALLAKIRPYIRTFHSSQYIDALANGSACLVMGWSGDVLQARDRAEEAGNGVKVAYAIPKEGAPLFFDMLAIPRDAKNIDQAYAFIDYLLRPDVAASNTNYVSFPNPVPASLEQVDEEIRNDPTIYPPPEVAGKLFMLAVVPPEVDRLYTRIWTELKSGR
ncbi:polyamine ABC transporter substrate-binding protein [Pseudoxanthomonas sp. SGNA-20]|jgi:Spermidine/putrescine-binding periplasmic protein|uniref:polyamine ABC transporter substrate-binding protein n=1 Tax=unclassified Pseudoxanthomonas TaxID=2645906 RepID=UPI0005648552|nr:MULTISPECIES: polyamine ABC transporter substrate-binding protein [unclassified Pseudoxanthomonas]RRN55856.1 polyamine ABC transporter substrate-binding protein [Pseudoxanthomonas sp. SGNA-20]RRN79131.1 polyamine ABC transporter substrate-binding protein [Pseudoxanthomonas sp. SGD-10]